MYNKQNFNQALQQAKRKSESYVSLFIWASVLVLIFSLTFFDWTKTTTWASLSSASASERPIDYERCATTVDRQAEMIRQSALKVEDACQSLEEEWCPAMNCEYLKWIATTEVKTDDELHNCVHWDWEIYRWIKWRCNSAWQAQDVQQLEASDRHWRMKEMLAYYWKEHLYEAFFRAGKMTSIYPELWICIAKADTTLWRHLKSKNNIWNVGNNDRWDTVEYKTEYEWVLKIFQVLNNSNLWHYNQVSELSRKFNKDWKIYASSEENWHNNVMNCLSVIRWESLPDDWWYRF